jgi:hypothetical protein
MDIDKRRDDASCSKSSVTIVTPHFYTACINAVNDIITEMNGFLGQDC